MASGFNTIPVYQNSNRLFVELDKTILKFIWKNKAVGPSFPDFRTCYAAAVAKAAWPPGKELTMDQWNRTESPEINLYIHSWPIDFSQRCKDSSPGKRITGLTNSVRIIGCPSQAKGRTKTLTSHPTQKIT